MRFYNMLTKKELKQLRNETTLNSLFLKDYDNTLFIKAKTVCNFFDTYMEYLSDNFKCKDIDDIFKHDNINNLYDYYLSYEHDPLKRDDFIAYKNIYNDCALVIYKIDYQYERVLSAFISSDTSEKPRYDKLYYDYIECEYYFIKNSKKHYLFNFLRIEA